MGVRKYLFKMKLKGKLLKCFKDGSIVKTVKNDGHTNLYYPRIHEIFVDDEKEAVRFTFTLKNGMNPELVTKNLWLFQQAFGENIQLTGTYKTFTLGVYSKGMPSKVAYQFKNIEPLMEKKVVPLVLGVDQRGELLVICLKELHHVLLTGSTGSGKSTLFRSMITSLILHKKPTDIQLVMADFKKSEFGIYRRLPHVKQVHMVQETFLVELLNIQKEMKRRGDLLDQYDLDHVSELEEKLPIILIVIDELFELTDNKMIMNILTKISALGRSSQIHIIAAMQSGRAADLGGQFLNNMNCRISGKQADSTNAKVSGLSTTKDISVPGRMAISLNGVEQHVQVPYLTKKEAKSLLDPFKQEVIDDPQAHMQVDQISGFGLEDKKVNEFVMNGDDNDE